MLTATEEPRVDLRLLRDRGLLARVVIAAFPIAPGVLPWRLCGPS